MEFLKRAVDVARLGIWAVLTAANDSDPAAFLERFRLRRAIEITRAVQRDLDDGSMRAWPAELEELAGVTKQLSATLEQRSKRG